MKTAAEPKGQAPEPEPDDWLTVFESEEGNAPSSSAVILDPVEHAQLARRLAQQWATSTAERRKRTEAADQQAALARRRTRERQDVETAQAQGRHRWRRYFSVVYFAYVLPGLVPLSVAASNDSQERMGPLWTSVLAPLFNWVGCLSLLSTPLAIDWSPFVPAQLDPMRGVAFSAPYYPLVNLTFWALLGALITIGYPMLWRTAVAHDDGRWSAVRPGGALMALGIGGMAVAVAVAVNDGSALSAFTSTASMLSIGGR
ncbi:MAG: hypothetical protein ABL986_23400 [Vicinamibacterales bacterium]